MTVRLFRQQALDNQTRVENDSDPVRRIGLSPIVPLLASALLLCALTGFVLL